MNIKKYFAMEPWLGWARQCSALVLALALALASALAYILASTSASALASASATASQSLCAWKAAKVTYISLHWHWPCFLLQMTALGLHFTALHYTAQHSTASNMVCFWQP